MLIPSVISIAIAVASSIGLNNFFSSANEGEEASNLSVKNVLMAVAFATVVVVVIKLIVKLIYGNEEIKEKPSTAAKQCKRKKSKNKLKQKKISKSEEEASDMVRQVEHCSLGAEVQEELKEAGEEFSINNIDEQEVIDQVEHCNLGAEVQEELKEAGEEFSITNNIDEQEVMDQETSTADEGWIDVEKKERRKKSHHLKQNGVSSVEDGNGGQNTAVRLSATNQDLRNTLSIRSMREDIVKEYKEIRGDRRLILKTTRKSKTTIVSSINCTQKISAKSHNIKPSSEKKNITATANKNVMHITSRDTVERKESQRSRQSTNPENDINYAQKVSAGLSKNISYTADKDATQVTSRDTVEGGGLEDQYLRQGARPKSSTHSVSRVSYARKVSAKLPNIEVSSKERDISPTANKGVTHITSRDTVERKGDLEGRYLKQCAKPEVVVPSSCMDFKQGSDFISISSDRSYNALVQPRCIAGGVRELYRKVAVRFCNKLKRFRQMHFIYCIKLIKRIFKVKDDKLIISEDVNCLFRGLTPHTEILFFMLKVFFLGNLSILCGGKNIMNNIRYCSTYFYDQSLLDLLISEVIMNVSEKDNFFKRNKIGDNFEFYCKHLQGLSNYTPYSGEFFRQVFNMCYNLASVELSEEDQELVDLATLACVIYCGHMVSMLCRMLVYDNDAKGGKADPLVHYLKAQRFCRQSSNLRATMIHMYHPTDENDCPRNVGDIISIPSLVWKNCSIGIHDLVKKSVNQNKMGFGVFVKDMVHSIKKLILIPNTGRLYEEDIRTYESKIKTVATLAPLPYTRIVGSDSSKSL